MIETNIIKSINKSYQYHKNILKENEIGIVDYPMSQVVIASKIISHIEFVINNMDDKYKVVLENDILFNRFDTSYKEGVSTSTYYRNRQQAYKLLIKELSQ